MPYIKRNSEGYVVGVARHPTEGFSEYSEDWPEIYKPPASYRDRRQQEYIKQLSPEGTFEKTVGDILDAVLKHLSGDSADLQQLQQKISEIKASIPAE